MSEIEPQIRNAVRGLIVRDNQVLLLKKDGYETGGVRYALPGGGQDAGESLLDTLLRECEEEIGCRVTTGNLVSVNDFIKRRDTEPVRWRHVVEFLFCCELPIGYRPHNGPAPDKHQVDVVWMPIDQLSDIQLFPQYLGELIPRVCQQQHATYQGRFVDPGFSRS
ncbi:NUDIX domain-containing protein [Marinobacterium mangrovicola]|uniref:ADP-ribose pyrophosphatase YjhB (NUDIX family) n=1 Tax=Marinobacterium mangrovicola TaxID=1476959 RepID=A0A4R1GN29_9GAMM|nr:NUDIX domain-containing protein [Marinobacterium mangrovicola]TCK08701.1 ADP-ribose pyrophosphatase YjhB (NUDIX family) [Marinobacterium mangrovicola]